jgi:hypothetical protein
MIDKINEEVRQFPSHEQWQLREWLNDETSDAERTRQLALSHPTFEASMYTSA